MTVCIDLLGRLGNNFFQISCAVGYAEKHHVDFVIPQWEYQNCFKTVFTKQAVADVRYGEKSIHHYEELPFIENVQLLGFFQSEKYFKHCESKIRELFQFNDSIKEVSKKYEIKGNTCSIHVRRGDYIGNNFHEVCHLKYYQDAISEMKRRANVDLFVVFSDDISWCKENLTGENFLFVEGNSNIEDLYLMSQCSNHIIANSSFSWWGAWLNPNKDKIVIAPNKWYGGESDNTGDILPDGWIKIKT